MFLIERKRGNNNIGLQDTKYYLLSSDQKLREWDNCHSENQPLLMLPSQWMGLLLKYVSRTTDDFASFLSFLRFSKHESVLSPEEIEDVVAGISEMTENFQTQATVMTHLVDDKFAKIISGNKTELRENTIQFTRTFLEEMYLGELVAKDKAHEDITKKLKNEYEKHLEENKLKSIKDRITSLERIKQLIFDKKSKVDKRIKRIRKLRLLGFITVSIIFYIMQYILFVIFGWDKIEPFIYFLGIPYPFISYIFLAISGKNWNPFVFFQTEFIQKKIYEKEEINLLELKDIETELADLNEQLKNQSV